MPRPAPKDIESFIGEWLAENTPVQRPENLPLAVDLLAARLTGDARARGISGGDLHRAFGDIDNYLTEHCLQAAAS